MNLDDDELLELRKAGHKVTMAPPKPKDAEKPSEMAQIVTQMKDLATAMKAAADRPSEAPEVNVAAPNVTVQPHINVKYARVLEAEVTERDEHRSIKKIRFTVIE